MTEYQKRMILIAAIITSLVPAILLMKFPTLVSFGTVALYISAILGYMGIVLLLWMYILGTKSVFGLIFQDLASVLSIHKWLGKYAPLLIFLHPIFVTIGYGEQWFYSILPQAGTLVQRHVLLGQISIWLLAGTWLISAYIRGRMSWRIWKYIHFLAYICVPFALLHVPDLGSQEHGSTLVKAYLFTLGLTFVAFFAIRLRSLLNFEKAQYTVMRHIQLTDLDHMVQLHPIQPLGRVPRRGQYVYIKLGFLSEDHPFSITQYDEKTGDITLAYRIAGMYTKEVQKLLEGSIVLLSGPYGKFTDELAHDDTQPVVYIAGGIGITPFVDRIVRESEAREQWLFAANRNRSLAVLYEPLKKRLGDRAVAIYNQQDGIPLANEESGYITADLLTKYLGDLHRYHYYICGPSPMMHAVRRALADMGISESSIRSEKFGW